MNARNNINRLTSSEGGIGTRHPDQAAAAAQVLEAAQRRLLAAIAGIKFVVARILRKAAAKGSIGVEAGAYQSIALTVVAMLW